MILGLIREYKNPPDKRVAFSPEQCKRVQNGFQNIKIIAESSPVRAFNDKDYENCGITVSENMTVCDFLFGIKEVPPEKLIASKTYLFFSHTIKKQIHNREMLKEILRKNITLIDYECLRNRKGSRILGFGKYAGIVGTYEIFRAMGKKYNIFNWQSPSEYKNYDELKTDITKDLELIKLQKKKIVLTGSGRVISGCEELLEFMNISKVEPLTFLKKEFSQTVYTLLDIEDMFERNDGNSFTRNHFYENHKMYSSKFLPYTKISDIMINGIYWDSNLPRHFEKEDTISDDFRINLIADISCDIEGSIPITIRETTIENPVFGWDGKNQAECTPYSKNSIDIMAISNLPTELPADASIGFGEDLIKSVLPELFKSNSEIIENATICKNGELTPKYKYLQSFID